MPLIPFSFWPRNAIARPSGIHRDLPIDPPVFELRPVSRTSNGSAEPSATRTTANVAKSAIKSLLKDTNLPSGDVSGVATLPATSREACEPSDRIFQRPRLAGLPEAYKIH